MGEFKADMDDDIRQYYRIAEMSLDHSPDFNAVKHIQDPEGTWQYVRGKIKAYQVPPSEMLRITLGNVGEIMGENSPLPPDEVARAQKVWSGVFVLMSQS